MVLLGTKHHFLKRLSDKIVRRLSQSWLTGPKTSSKQLYSGNDSATERITAAEIREAFRNGDLRIMGIGPDDLPTLRRPIESQSHGYTYHAERSKDTLSEHRFTPEQVQAIAATTSSDQRY